ISDILRENREGGDLRYRDSHIREDSEARKGCHSSFELTAGNANPIDVAGNRRGGFEVDVGILIIGHIARKHGAVDREHSIEPLRLETSFVVLEGLFSEDRNRKVGLVE